MLAFIVPLGAPSPAGKALEPVQGHPKIYEGIPGYDPEEITLPDAPQSKQALEGGGDGGAAEATTSVIKKGDDECLKMEQVAEAWMGGISKYDKANAKAMCVPAVAIAAGSSYDTPQCPGKFDSTAEGGATARGLWQIGAMYYDPDPKKQAQAVYQFYTSDNPDYGCLSDWCKSTTCGEAHDGIGQDSSTISHHRFCKGAWPAASGQYAARLLQVGGKTAVAEACGNKAAAQESLMKNMSVPFKEWAAVGRPTLGGLKGEQQAKNEHSSADCNNEHEDAECDGWASQGECDVNPDYMRKSCARSCASCG